MTQTSTDATTAIIRALAGRAALMERRLNEASKLAGKAREHGDVVSMRNAFETQLMAQMRWEEADWAHRHALRIANQP